MPSEFFTTAIVTVLDMLTTYLLHSTLLLTIAALVSWCYRRQSHALTERLWKSAAVIPLLTVPLQLVCGVGNSVFSPHWSEPVREVVGLDQAMLPAPEMIDVDDVKPTSVPPEAGIEPLSVEIDATPIAPYSSAGLLFDSSRPLPIENRSKNQAELRSIPETATSDSALTDSTVTLFVKQPTSVVIPPLLPGFASWLAGLVVFIMSAGALRFFITGWRFRRRVRRFRTVEAGRVFEALSRVVHRAALRRRVRLLEADDVREPIAFGLWRWTIVVPADMETRLDRNELEALLAHELAHLVRGDTWWLLMGRLLCCCLPFQPLNFLARERWKQAAEFQCDDWAASQTDDPLSLAHCLTCVAEWRLDVANFSHVLPAGGSDSTLSRRVERLLADRPAVDTRKRSRRGRLSLACILFVMIVLCWHGPRTTLLARFSAQRNPLALDAAITLDLADGSLADEIDSLNAELRDLESDLRKVELLVRNHESPSEVRRLASGLSSRLAFLRHHRRELLARAKPASIDFVNVSDNKTQPYTLSAESSR